MRNVGSMGVPGIIFFTIPIGTAAFAIGAILLSKALSFKRTLTAVLLAVCGFGFTALLRSDGMWGELGALELNWRWNPSQEEQMLARREDQPEPERAELATDEADLWLANPEWFRFRGAARTSCQHGPPISADWSISPPDQIWKIPVGPGWSSFTVAGNLLFTQEQRGPLEMILCYVSR